MSAILPPSERLWWKHPLDRLEAVWIGIAFVWCMIMFFMMVGWHIYGKQNLSTETYEKVPGGAPPEGSDVYLIARLWNFWPILELEKGKSYKLHLTSMEVRC